MKEYEDFEALNEDYTKLKLKEEMLGKFIESNDHDLDLCKKAKENIENTLKTAAPKDKGKLQGDLKKIIVTIEKLEADIEKDKSEIENVKNEVNEIIDSVKSMPEIAEQCKQAVDKNTSRKIDKFQKQKKEQEEKKVTLTELRNIIQKHPQAQIFVNNIENKSLEISKRELELDNINKKINDIDKEISELDPSDKDYASKKAKLDADKAKLDPDRNKLEGECTKLKGERKAERDGLKKLLNNPKYNDQIDNLTTRTALDKNINNCERLIRRNENKINDYRAANISLNAENAFNTPTEQTTPNVPTKWETFKSNFKDIFSKKEPGEPSRLSKFGKAFKNLFKKQEALPAPIPTNRTSPFREDVKIKNPMQYQVVKDIFEANKDTVKDTVKKSSEARETAKKDKSDDGSR